MQKDYLLHSKTRTLGRGGRHLDGISRVIPHVSPFFQRSKKSGVLSWIQKRTFK